MFGVGMGVGFGFVIVQCLVVFGAQVCLTLILERKGGGGVIWQVR